MNNIFQLTNRLGAVLNVGFRLCLTLLITALFYCIPPNPLSAQILCAKAQIQLSAQATLERQAFLATMTIQDGLPSSLTNLNVSVTGTNSVGGPIVITNDTTNTSALFFINIQSITPAVTPLNFPITVLGSTSSTITWLIIPTVGAGGTNPAGQMYNIGADVTYMLNGQQQSFSVAPAAITVMPLPLLVLDSFIPQNVYGDNPLTPQVEPSIPFVFGIRVKNTGAGAANNLQIQSSQPTIVSNVQGLAETVKLIGCEVNGAPSQPTLLSNFGNVGPGQATVADWIMESSLTGTFSNFTASFSHSGALGGQLTSVIQSVTAHLMNHLVLIDTPGSDTIPDFLAYDTNNNLNVYGSDGIDQPVTDISTTTVVSSSTTKPASGSPNAYPLLTFQVPAVVSGLLYSSQPDPSNGNLSVVSVLRSDAKVLNPENYWLWSSFNKITQKFDYFVALFDDSNSSGLTYTITYGPPNSSGPVFATVPTQLITVGKPFNLTVKATDSDGTIPVVALTNAPNGATFTDNKNGTGTLTWTALSSEQGSYSLAFVGTETLSNGSSLTGNLAVTCNVSTQTPLQSWISQYFPGVTDPNIIGDLANPAHDGLSNLVKYALNLDPTQAEADPTVLGTTVVSGKHYLTLTYTHRTDDPTLVFSVIGSPLANAPISSWTAQTTQIPVDQTGVPVEMETDEIQDSVPIETGTPNRYLKLQVTQTGSQP